MKAAFPITKNRGKMGLLHRDFGFRIIMSENDHVKGVIDFEKDISRRSAFFAGWEKTSGQHVDWNRLWLYLAIQGLGAVQWVNRQEALQGRMENADYREKGIWILREACERLRKATN